MNDADANYLHFEVPSAGDRCFACMCPDYLEHCVLQAPERNFAKTRDFKYGAAPEIPCVVVLFAGAAHTQIT